LHRSGRFHTAAENPLRLGLNILWQAWVIEQQLTVTHSYRQLVSDPISKCVGDCGRTLQSGVTRE
jgi:hypothetical protein